MKNATFSIVLIAAAAAAYLAGAWHTPRETVTAAPLHTRAILYYVDPMHPSYTSDRPGKAPDCGMDLEPVYADAADAAGSAPVTAAQF
jgi:Cu(I)/Ag(I) efflux system membrane fusion protein